MLPGDAIKEAATVALSCVLLMTVVGRAVPFHCTTEPAAPLVPVVKFVPVTVIWRAAEPAGAEVGAMDATVGTEAADGPTTGKETALDSCLSAFCTWMSATAGAVIREAGIMAVSELLLTYPVTSVWGPLPVFHRTAEVDWKPDPVIVICSVEDPVVACAGLMPELFEIEGAGTGSMVKGTRFETTPVAFCTSRKAVPAVSSRLAGMSAVNWFELR